MDVPHGPAADAFPVLLPVPFLDGAERPASRTNRLPNGGG